MAGLFETLTENLREVTAKTGFGAIMRQVAAQAPRWPAERFTEEDCRVAALTGCLWHGRFFLHHLGHVRINVREKLWTGSIGASFS
ncbi:MAG TPA: hypothetical protein P5026_02735 [Kiritimatiellia bacterium]|nr:hypothetical protein [Kiritimatiellia bacterium]HRU70664.1 hypothetical protein [Kiritimatiellia bacterium]